MKRKSFHPISTLLLSAGVLASSLCLVHPVHAYNIEESAVDPALLPSGTEIDGKRYWTVDEMITASALINAKRQEFCAGNYSCEESLSWQQPEQFGGIYHALDSFDNSRLMLTAINPSEDTFSLLYHDEDKMESQMFGTTVRHDITSIYAVWVAEPLGDPTVSINWLAYDQRAPYHMGSVEEVEAATHLILDESDTELGLGWFTPNIERAYHAEGGNLAANTRMRLYFAYNSTGGHVMGTIDYSSCINSPAYTDGMECRIMYRDDGPYTYLPVTPTIPEIASETPARLMDPASDTADPVASTEESTSGHGGISATATKTTEPSSMATSESAISAPNTGAATREDCNEDGSNEFPWWAVLLPFILAFFVFSWWFLLPLFRHSNEKNG